MHKENPSIYDNSTNDEGKIFRISFLEERNFRTSIAVSKKNFL